MIHTVPLSRGALYFTPTIKRCKKPWCSRSARLTVKWVSWPVLRGHRWQRRAAASTARCPERWRWLLGPAGSSPSHHSYLYNTVVKERGEEKEEMCLIVDIVTLAGVIPQIELDGGIQFPLVWRKNGMLAEKELYVLLLWVWCCI